MTFLWLYASGRYFVGDDAVNVWLSVVTVQIPTYLPMRAVVTNECDGPKRPVVRPVTESDGEILNEIGVLPNENGEPCGGISLGQQVQVAAFVPSILLKPFGRNPGYNRLRKLNQFLDVLVRQHGYSLNCMRP